MLGYAAEKCAPCEPHDEISYQKSRAAEELEKAAAYLRGNSPSRHELASLRKELDELYVQQQIQETKRQIRGMKAQIEEAETVNVEASPKAAHD